MADATKLSLADLRDPTKYLCKPGVPWFRSHKRQVLNEKTGQYEDVEVNESDLSEIADNMQALCNEGRAFRITNGHIKKDADEANQPKFLGLAMNPRLGKFGPKQIPAVLVDEYIRLDRLDDVGDRPYRSAEYYRGKKTITGCAALLRDPQLNLGVVLYSGDEAAVFYGEPVDTVPEMSSSEDDLSPEEVSLFERFMKYMQRSQQQQAGMQQQQAAMGPMNAMPQQPAAYQEQDEMANTPVVKPTESPEFYELKTQYEKTAADLKASNDRLAAIEKERVKEKAERLLDDLDKIEHFRFDRADELEAMLATDDAGRAKIVNRIRKNHEKQPGYDDQVPVNYSSDNRPLPDRTEKNPITDEPELYAETMEYIRETGETDFAKAQRTVRERFKK